MDKRAFGQALESERTAHGMDAEGFARAMGISLNEYLSYEKGEASPSLELAHDFAEALGVPLERLTGSTYMPKLRMGKEDGVSKLESEQMLRELEDAADLRYHRGKKIMIAIIVVEAISLLLGVFFTNILATIFSIVMLVCLYRGHIWARVVFIILNVLAALANFANLGNIFPSFGLYGSAAVSTAAIVVVLVILAWQITACLLLTINRSVSEFLYEQSTRK